MIFPCPGFPAVFLPFAIDDEAVDAGVLSLAAGSSSENDSHAGSSFVTTDEASQHSVVVAILEGYTPR